MSERRTIWVDAAKGLTISLVVLHHVYSGVRFDTPVPVFLADLSTVLFTLRMPLFFTVAGLFALKTIQGSWKQLIDTKILHFGYFYFVWSIIDIATRHAAGGVAHHQTELVSLLRIVWDPPLTLWFIYALVIAFFIARLTRSVAPEIQIACATACSAFVIANFDDRSEILLRVMRYYPFFLVGLYASNWIRSAVEHSTWAVTAASTAAFIALAYWSLKLQLFTAAPAYYAMALFGCTATLSALYLNRNGAAVRALRFVGERSLYVYLMHFLPAAGYRIVLQKLGVEDPVAIVLIAWPLSVMTCLLVYEIARRTPLRFLFERPVALHRFGREAVAH